MSADVAMDIDDGGNIAVAGASERKNNAGATSTTTSSTATTTNEGRIAGRSAEGWVIMVSGINPEVSEPDVLDLFEDYGRVTAIRLNQSLSTGYLMVSLRRYSFSLSLLLTHRFHTTSYIFTTNFLIDSQGYALLQYDSRDEAAAAIAEQDGASFFDQTIDVDWAFLDQLDPNDEDRLIGRVREDEIVNTQFRNAH